MKIDNDELKNYWNDKERVIRAEKQLLKEEKRKEALDFISANSNRKNKIELNLNNKRDIPTDERVYANEPILDIKNTKIEHKNAIGLLVLGALIMASIFMTYFVYSAIKEQKEENKIYNTMIFK